MLKLYKDWYLDADPHQYILGKLKKRARDGRASLEIDKPTYHPTIAAAANHVLEAEMRQKVADKPRSSLFQNAQHNECLPALSVFDVPSGRVASQVVPLGTSTERVKEPFWITQRARTVPKDVWV